MHRVTVIILSVMGVLVLAILAIPFLLDANSFRPKIESELSQALGRDVKIGDLKLSIFKGTVTAGNLSVADDPAFSREPFLTAKSIGFVVALAPALFHHTLNVSGIDVENPQIALIQTHNGLWNFSTMGTAKSQVRPVSASNENLALSIKSLKVADALVSVIQGSKPQVLEHVNIEVKDFAPNVSFPFTLTGKMQGGGDIGVNGRAGPINAGNSASTPLNANLRIIKLNLTGTGIVPASEGVDGLVSLDGTATSDGRAMHFAGKISGERMKFAPGGTPARNSLLFDVDLTSQLADHTGRLKQGDIAIGGVKSCAYRHMDSTGRRACTPDDVFRTRSADGRPAGSSPGPRYRAAVRLAVQRRNSVRLPEHRRTRLRAGHLRTRVHPEFAAQELRPWLKNVYHSKAGRLQHRPQYTDPDAEHEPSHRSRIYGAAEYSAHRAIDRPVDRRRCYQPLAGSRF